MKGFALVLLCVVAASQARSTGLLDAKSTLAEAGDAPWLVHLRMSVWTSGLLTTCAASLIDQRWLLTSASCVDQGRFIWSRYNALVVIQPELVTETGTPDANIIPHPNYDAATGANNIALISLNRNVEFTSSIAGANIATEGLEVPASGTLCAFGANEEGGPGEQQRCFPVALESADDGTIVATSDDGELTNFDLGVPLVVDGVQYGVLVDPATGTFLNPAAFRDWIESTAGISLPGAPAESDEEESDE